MSEPILLGPDTSWGSHLAPLTACIAATNGAILEMGAGHWSTPFLHRYAVAAGRDLVTVDEDAKWIEQFADMRMHHHELRAVNYNDFVKEACQRTWSVVLLDHSPGWRRAQDAMFFRDVAEYLVVHDYSGEEVSHPFEPILDQWSHRLVAQFSPSTLVLSRLRHIPRTFMDAVKPEPIPSTRPMPAS